ncbi:MAG: TIR domain-containing protein, partial [Ktedonobacteraceae bacterium]
MATHNEQPVPIFCAYAPEDERFYQELAVHLHIFSSRMLCTLSHAGDIPAGSEREHALISLIEQARLVLVLLSPDYFRSVFSDNGVLQELLARKAKQECLIPLLLRACAWQDSLFSIFLPLPRDGSPISSKAQRDAAWLAIVEEIRPRITQLAAGVSDKALAKMTRGHAGPWCVPYRRNPFFTGRDELLAMLHERLHTDTLSGQTLVLAISGLGGIGKTQVALEYAYRYRGDYSAVLWVTAETPEMLLADFIRFVEPLGLSAHLEQGSGDLVSFVKDWLHQHRDWLLIFDNADTIEVVRDYLPAQFRSQGQILLTTRATTAGELAKMIHVEDMSASEGELFLLRRAGLLATEAPLEQAHEQRRRDAAHIVAELDGLPLGIDQAGAYIAETSCSLEHYLRVFHQCRARLLAQRGKLPPGHPEPVATTWKLSFQRIERTAAADLLRLCAFFSPDSIPEAIFLTGASVLGPRLARFA